MGGRFIWILLGVALAAGCDNSPTAPTGADLAVVITPNPLTVPAAGEKLVWNVALRETAGVGLRLDRDEMVVLDSAGVKLAQQNGSYSGCTSCPADLHVGANQSMTFNGMSAMFLGAPHPGSFHYTMYYTDEMGHARSTAVTVPVM